MRLVSLRLACALTLSCVFAGPVVSPARADAAPAATASCGDFLTLAHRKPAHVLYQSCQPFPDRQGKPLRAIYAVNGRFAAATEAYFIKSAGLHRLKRSCCLWDSPASSFRDATGREFTITMVSVETPIRRRAEWWRIPRFEIAVELLTEEI